MKKCYCNPRCSKLTADVSRSPRWRAGTRRTKRLARKGK